VFLLPHITITCEVFENIVKIYHIYFPGFLEHLDIEVLTFMVVEVSIDILEQIFHFASFDIQMWVDIFFFFFPKLNQIVVLIFDSYFILFEQLAKLIINLFFLLFI